MRPGGRHIKKTEGRLIVDLYACFLIPAYTLLYAGGTKWFSTNFSVLATGTPARFLSCLYWGVLLGAYYAVMMVRIGRTMKRSALPGVLTVLACVCLVAALLLPYAPEQLPQEARLHVILSFSACALMMLVLLLILLQLYGRSAAYRRMLKYWAGIVSVSGLLFFAAGKVTSLVEIWFVITTALLIRGLWLQRTAECEIK